MIGFNKHLFSVMLCALIGHQINYAQIITDKSHYNFGEINKDDKKYVDFQLTNASSFPVKITKFETPYGVSLRFSDKVIDADESILVRIKYTPKRKGAFKADVPIYVSSNSEPIILTIEGKAITFNADESLDVPEFDDAQEEKASETFSLDIRVVRKDDKSPVEGARLDIIWDGVLYKNIYTNTSGQISHQFTADKYYLVVSANNLGTFESELSIHPNVRELLIELGPEGSLSMATEDSADVYETELVDVAELGILIENNQEVIPEDQKTGNEELPIDQFSANNIVFLIDVSISMKEKGKMNLLKASMIEMTDLLRPIDKVAIVTYSSKAQLVLKSTSAAEKDKIKEIITGLEPKGSTAGLQGIKKAYQVLGENKLVDGNNQIFISTDGAFNFDKHDKGLLETVRKNSEKGYKLSVIGIKNEKHTVKNMKQLAGEGKGNYLHISNYSDAQRELVDEIKIQSKTIK